MLSERRATTALTPVTAPLVRQPPDVILIDDDRALSSMIQFGLVGAGRTVASFDSGPEALAALIALPPGQPRVVLLGVDLAGMDGHTLHEQLLAARPGEFRVAFLSDRDSDADQLRALGGGAIDYVVKPVSIGVLLMKIDGWLSACSDRP